MATKKKSKNDSTAKTSKEAVPVVSSVSEEDRAQLSEVWNEVRATKNAQVALVTEARRLDAERRVAEAEAKTQELIMQQQEQQLQAKLDEIRHKYNIPDGYEINSKTGVVSVSSSDEGANQ